MDFHTHARIGPVLSPVPTVDFGRGRSKTGTGLPMRVVAQNHHNTLLQSGKCPAPKPCSFFLFKCPLRVALFCFALFVMLHSVRTYIALVWKIRRNHSGLRRGGPKYERQRRFLQPRVRVRFRRRCVVGRYSAICCTRYTFPSNYSAGKTENCHK